MSKVKVGVIGGAGYTAGELLRLLLNHPKVEIKYIHSKSNATKPVSQVHSDLVITDWHFSENHHEEIDVLFLCLGHGESEIFLTQNPFPKRVKIIDLSQDFRILEKDHGFLYGLPEMQREKISQAQKVANPGCFATCIQLALLPLAQTQNLQNEIHITGVTGSTGAGQKLQATTHFSWRDSNISVYKAFQHQHLKEIGQSLKQLQTNFSQAINFIPMRGNFTRGILASTYMKSSLSEREAKEIYSQHYQSHPFVYLLEENPDLKQVINTNNCFIYLRKYQDKLHIISIIDNLLKGASGQAVQNMNLMLGWDEKTALQLKAASF